jgi:hypothetical protein
MSEKVAVSPARQRWSAVTVDLQGRMAPARRGGADMRLKEIEALPCTTATDELLESDPHDNVKPPN